MRINKKRILIFLLAIIIVLSVIISCSNAAYAAETYDVTITGDISEERESGSTALEIPDVFIEEQADSLQEGDTTELTELLRADELSDLVDVMVSEKIMGEFSDMTRRFKFFIYFMDAEGSKLAEGKKFTYTGSLLAGINGISAPPDGVLVLDKEGKDTFTLGHGQAIVIKGIPLGSKIRIVQETGSDFASFIEDNSEGYLISNNTGDKSLNKEGRKFNFINMHAAPVPTGLDENVRTSAALLFLPASLAAIIVPCFFVIERTRRDCGFRDRC